MTVSELIAASLVLSSLVGGAAWLIGLAIECHVRDSEIRERVWGMALYATVIPPAVVGLSILMPVSSAAPAGVATLPFLSLSLQANADAAGLASWFDGGALATGLLALAVLTSSIKGVSLAVRVARLRCVVRGSRPAGAPLVAVVEQAAYTFGFSVPRVRIVADATGPLLTGFARPLLLLPDALAAQPHAPATRMIGAHELAHMARADHRSLWIEEILSIVFAINPAIRAIRDRRAAAREEACDALVLSSGGEADRRVYARALVEALRAQPPRSFQPALTFTSSKRIFAMKRLNAILNQAPPAGLRTRSVTVASCVAIATLACTGSLAVAAQGQSVTMAVGVTAVTRAVSPAVSSPDQAMPMPAARIPGSATKAEAAGTGAPSRSVPLTQDRAIEPRAITNPTWASPPAPQWPSQAGDTTEAEVDLSCTVSAVGTVSGCSVIDETPAGIGFGTAAIAAAEQAKLAPQPGGQPGGIVRFTIRFRKG